MPIFTSFEKKSDYPILIVDKIGLLGEQLISKLKEESLIIFVSAKRIEDKNVIHVPFLKKIPTIPDNSYSHIFVIDEYAKISKSFLTPFINKAKHDQSKIVLAININFADEKFVQDFISSYELAKIALFGDIFSNEYIYEPDTYINMFLKEACELGKIDIPGDGTKLTNPVLLEDVVMGILQAGFIEDNISQTFFLYPKQKTTLLSLAHMFQKKEPTLKIDFIKELKQKDVRLDLSVEGKYLLGEEYDLTKKIAEIDISKNKPAIKREEEKSGAGSKLSYLFTAAVLVMGFFFLLPVISTLFLSGSGALFLNNMKTNLINQNLTGAKNDAIISYGLLSAAKSTSQLLEKEALIFGQQERVSNFSAKIDQGVDVSFGARSALLGVDKINELISSGSNISSQSFTGVSNDLKNALVIYQKQKEIGNIPSSLDTKLSDMVSLVSTTLDLWPDILGFDKEKNYLILFQNNMELRPGGGFIGSYAILTIDKASVKSFKVYDVYDADGQLKAHVEPPFAIRRYLNSANWYLRDSNFDVDFSKDAAASVVFLNSEMHQSVDGVIGVDLSFVKNLLQVLGPVDVVDYNQAVTSDNLFKIANSQVQDKFFPGSTQKKDFLSSLFTSIELKLSDKKISYLNLISAISKSIFEKHIIFAFNNVSMQSVFSVNGWGSTFFDSRKNTSNNVNDFFGINEANLGANKVNYYIQRSIAQEVSIDGAGAVSENIKINISNLADKSLGKDSIYKDYIRIITPINSKITGIKIDGSEQKVVAAITDPAVYEAKGFVPPTGLEVNTQTESGKTIFGFLNIINPGKLKTIEVKYTLSQKINLPSNNFSYSSKIFKQPGIDSFPFVFSLNYPAGFRSLNTQAGFKSKQNKVYASVDLVRDLEFSLNLARQ